MPAAPTPGARSRVVLVVDDEPDIGRSLCLALERRLPYVRVVPFTAPADALGFMRENRVDLVISDFKMPGMTGLDFLERARELAPTVPRVIMTAYPDQNVVMRGINDVKLEHFFTKPFRLEDVIGAVSDMLAQRDAEAEKARAIAAKLDAARRGLG